MTHLRTPRGSRALAGGAAGALALAALSVVPLSAAVTAASAQPAAAPAAAPGTTYAAGNATQLRRAVRQANTNPGKDTIRIVDNITLDEGGGSGGGVFDGDLEIVEDVVVLGDGNVINANRLSRVFDVTRVDARLVVKQLDMFRGTPEDEGDKGGFIASVGTVRLVQVQLFGGRTPGASGSGGALFNQGGTMVLKNSAVGGGRAVRAGGAIEAEGDSLTIIRNTRLRNNRAGYSAGAVPGNGGAFHQSGGGEFRAINSSVRYNRASTEGGGLWNGTGRMLVRDTLVNSNNALGDTAAENGGGGIFNDGGNVQVTRGSRVNFNDASGAAGSGGGLMSVEGGSLFVGSSTVKGNSAVRAGGGVEATGAGADIDLIDARLLNNSAGVGTDAAANPGNGGGMHVTTSPATQTVNIVDSVVTGNQAASEGGGLWNDDGWEMTVTDTEVSGNEAQGADATNGGGGIFNNGGVLLVNEDGGDTVISENEADGAEGSGGGVFVNGGDVDILGAEISSNDAVRAGGGIEVIGTATVDTDTVDFDQNSTGDNPGSGGAVHANGADVTVNIVDGSITGHQADANGGGLWLNDGEMTASGPVTFNGNNADGEGDDAYHEADSGGTLTVNGGMIAAGTGTP